ncbi:MAG TPA: hypothetical protein VHM26_17675 [Chitinophagaceae bacterium]|jgi:hypothetical protein|nr:hypothetical protein [Chitinophagaceae bacterium]
MKKISFFLIAIAVASGLLFSSFNKKPEAEKKKPLGLVTYYYISGTYYQRLDPGYTTGILMERSLMQPVFTNAGNWTTIPQTFFQTSDYSKYIGAIMFNEEGIADGGADGQLTLQEALNAVWTGYTSSTPRTMAPGYTVDGYASIDIIAADAAH